MEKETVYLFHGVGGVSTALHESVEKVAAKIMPSVPAGEVIQLTQCVDRRRGTLACPFCGGEFADVTTETASCDDCGQMIRTHLGQGTWIYVKEEFVAHYIAQTIGDGDFTRSGSYYHFGAIRGRTLFYAGSPNKTFYSMHRGDDTAIIVGRHDCEVPDNCKAHIAPLSDLFSINVDTGDVRTARNILHRLLPKEKETRHPPSARVIHERRDEWLQFIMHLLSKPLKKADFWRGHIRPQVVYDWFIENVKDAPTSTKTYQRDLKLFLHIDKKNVDRREAFIVLLLHTAMDATRTRAERLGIAKMIPPLIEYLAKTTKQMNGRPVEITRAAWQYCKDGTREYIPVVDIEAFFDEMEKRLDKVA